MGKYGNRLSATKRVSRKDFGLTWNAALEAGGLLVGDAVTITLDVQFIKRALSAQLIVERTCSEGTSLAKSGARRDVRLQSSKWKPRHGDGSQKKPSVPSDGRAKETSEVRNKRKSMTYPEEETYVDMLRITDLLSRGLALQPSNSIV